MKLCDYEFCTGCMACMNSCPHKAITTEIDSEGFFRPVVDLSLCTDCGQCSKACPLISSSISIKKPKETYKKKVYSCWLKSKALLRESSSGGAFSAFAESLLSKNGIIYGAGFDSDNKVYHKRIVNRSQLADLRGSKYVQSEIRTSFSDVKKDLQQGRIVLFTGTPCQIDGLYHYLGCRYEKQLFTVDLVCHGVPSPKVYYDYLQYMESIYGSKVKRISFRNKNPGWYVYGTKIIFEDGQVYEQDNWQDPFMRGFLRNWFLRPSCYRCKYANADRPADITIADDWGFKEEGLFDRDNDQGISMVMINSENGELLFNQSKSRLHVFQRTIEKAIKGNAALNKPFDEPLERSDFWKDYQSLSFDEIIRKYLYSEEIPESIKNRRNRIHIARKQYLKKRVIHEIKSCLLILLGADRYISLKRKLFR